MKIPCWIKGHRPDKSVKLWDHSESGETHYQSNCKNCPHKQFFFIDLRGRHNYNEVRTH